MIASLGEHPLTREEVRTRYPALGVAVGDERLMR